MTKPRAEFMTEILVMIVKKVIGFCRQNGFGEELRNS